MSQEAPDFEQPISFVSQQTGVASASERAAERAQAGFVKVEQTVPPGSTVTVPNVTQAVPTPAVQEVLAMTSVAPHVPETQVRLKVDTDGNGTTDAVPVITPRISAIEFTPGVLATNQTQLDIDLINDGSQATDISAQAIFREL